jgi:hypothetical protein
LPTYYKRKHHIIPNITYDIIPDIIPDIMPDIFDILFSAGLCVSCRPIPFPEPEAAADSRPDSGIGSRLFEINIWMWRYGRISPRDVTVADAVGMRKQRVEESRAAALQRRRMQAQARAAGAQLE